MESIQLTEIEGFVLDLIRLSPGTASMITGEVCKKYGHPMYPVKGPHRDRRVDNALRRLRKHGLIRFTSVGTWDVAERGKL